MRTVRGTSAKPRLLAQYSATLVKAVERSRADVATAAAQRDRALAEVARIDVLKAQARDPERSEFIAHMFVAHMSHELRTPLNAIIGFSDMLRLSLKELVDDGKVLGYADDINSAGWHLLRLINDILDLSKIEAGKMDLSEEEFDFNEVALSCARMIKGLVDERQITFATEIAPGLPHLRADNLKIKQVIINLLSNAVKFTPAGAPRIAANTRKIFAKLAIEPPSPGNARKDSTNISAVRRESVGSRSLLSNQR
jgi:signal transduction histidine kinase